MQNEKQENNSLKSPQDPQKKSLWKTEEGHQLLRKMFSGTPLSPEDKMMLKRMAGKK